MVQWSNDVRRWSGGGEGLKWWSGRDEGLKWWSGRVTSSDGGPMPIEDIGHVENIGRKIVLGTVQDDPIWSDRPGTIWRSAWPI
ncbi:hypothetical protein MA16_Dca020903 [Dendrobium catenatum]|uniref:Uncharacterized protein n=1 Tax=Dendrobium catenatum TaxID=906689 RepID=A0A2I0VN35_9ASPA|nr:hypothetical protein MA16_Dca020903 [Dendrobium catenatum]